MAIAIHIITQERTNTSVIKNMAKVINLTFCFEFRICSLLRCCTIFTADILEALGSTVDPCPSMYEELGPAAFDIVDTCPAAEDNGMVICMARTLFLRLSAMATSVYMTLVVKNKTTNKLVKIYS
ncbi:hypothetical protein DPMN_117360 [Dreissena polymorpha]|uniref:Uncharacterized protein n=1 Tax=Dreissena polymorpha TaxID=45954 RepID=A0A9D4KQS1_DREPO|nr:hypothetical protein DPMN_117360 [Dreissena polymorpha]